MHNQKYKPRRVKTKFLESMLAKSYSFLQNRLLRQRSFKHFIFKLLLSYCIKKLIRVKRGITTHNEYRS